MAAPDRDNEARLRNDRLGDRMIALFLLGAVATGPPILGIVGVPGFVFGIPLLYAWLLAIWAIIIGLLAFSVASRSEAIGDGRGDVPPED